MDAVVPKPGTFELVYKPDDGSPTVRYEVFKFEGSGIILGMYNTDKVSHTVNSLGDTTIIMIECFSLVH